VSRRRLPAKRAETPNETNFLKDFPPRPFHLADSQIRQPGNLIDGRHLMYPIYMIEDLLADTEMGLTPIHRSSSSLGFFIVQCNGEDLSKVDDLNSDGKIDAKDIEWVQDVIANSQGR